MLSFIIAALFYGPTITILALALWECWQAEKLSRKLPPL